MAIDVATSTAAALKRACAIFLSDLNALPEEAFDCHFGGKARTVADIVHEVNLVNDHVGLTLRGEALFPWPEGWITAPEDQRTKATSIAAFEKSSTKVIEMVDGFSNDDLERTIVNEHGEQTFFASCRHMTVHLWYHSGQLNFIQTLLDDDGWHW